MFNVRPDALSPWLYVEPPQPDDRPGFRIAPDGSVIDAKRATPFGNDLRAGTEPSTGTDFEAGDSPGRGRPLRSGRPRHASA